MANIARNEPRSALYPFDPFGDFDTLFAPVRLRSLFRDLREEPQIRMDVREDSGVYRVKADVPGVKKEDIRVSIEGNVVTISAEVTREKEEKKDETVLCSERYYGRQSRRFTLRQDIDEAKAEAKYQDGVLELVLPTKSSGAARELAVK